MRYITLEAVTDEYDNAPGFALADAPRYDGFMADRGDVILAHDIVEHPNGLSAIGPIWDELEAVGGVWCARGQWGDLMQDAGGAFSPAENVASDIVEMARKLQWLEFRDADAMGTRPPATRPHICDDDFAEIISIARNQIPAELDDEQADAFDMEQYLDEALARMRIGFRKTARRFSAYGRFGANNQFAAIKREVQRAAREIEWEGQRFRLGWGAGECTIKELYEEDAF